ncbi:hypothetical protein [Agromyces sp. SYSU T00194]|uniref:hypothetical protein n=1 Tax=Agromyces chitinivorans TaxID=3158560 RepID=UPI00339869CA
MSGPVQLSIYLPADVYRALVESAERHGVQAHTLVEAMVCKSVRRTASVREREVRRLHALGKSDGVIGARLGISSSMARKVRQSLDLPPVGKPGRRRKDTA